MGGAIAHFPGDRKPLAVAAAHREDDCKLVALVLTTRTSVMFLLLSLVALFLGPALARASQGRDPLLAGLDGFVLVGVGGLALLHIFPEAIALAGASIVLSAALGFVLPGLLEHRFAHGEDAPTQRWVVVMVLAGLALHALLDGAALGLHEIDSHGHGHEHAGAGGDSVYLALGVILHRLPLGVAIWGTATAIWGSLRALIPLGVIAIATAAGFVLGEANLSALPAEAVGHFQGLIGGSLLHVMVGHHIPAVTPTRPHPVAAALGGVVAALALALLGHGHVVSAGSSGLDAGQTLVALALQSAPLVLAAFVGAGVITALAGGPKPGARLHARARPLQALGGLLLSATQPVCSCGVGTRYERLAARGLPLSAGLSFLVAAPELGLDAVLISLPLLGAELTLARVVAAVVVALAVGVVVSYLVPRPAVGPADLARVISVPGSHRLRTGARYALVEMVDHVGPWLVAGVAIAALAEPIFDDAVFVGASGALLVIGAAIVGVPTYVCASGATPLVAVLLHKGLSPGAAIAFVLTGPAVNVVTSKVLARAAGRGAVVAFAGVTVAGAAAAGFTVDALAVQGGLDLHAAAAAEATPLQVVSLVLVGALLAASLLRQGLRGFIGQVTSQLGTGHHEHEHEHEHEHGHRR